jgi:hypothetical protein
MEKHMTQDTSPNAEAALRVRQQMVDDAKSMLAQAVEHFTTVEGLTELEAYKDLALQCLYKAILISNLVDEETQVVLLSVPLIIGPGIIGAEQVDGQMTLDEITEQ